jgi:membrane peptidoglycan carboxypeptidase
MPQPRLSARNSAGKLSQLTVLVGVSVLTGVLLAGLAIPFAGLVGYTAHEGKDLVLNELPLQLETEPSPERSRILTRRGTTLATLYDQNRVELDSLHDVSPIMQKAIVAIEDSRFYRHGALDIQGTLRALIANQSSGETVQGGSSITQQLVKMTLIEQADTEAERLAATDDTYARKVRELRYALGVEEAHSKGEILLAYLNIAYFGDGAYGIEAAAQHFFGIPAKDLNVRQSAMLAGLVQNPTTFDPTNSPRLARERRDVVLERMGQLKVISPQRADREQDKPLALDVHTISNGCISSKAPFFCDYVENWLLTQPALGTSPEDRERLLLAGGLTVRTTLDMRFQRAANKAVKSHVDPENNVIGALAMVEPGTGEVRAVAQSRPMGNNTKRGQTYVNYTTPPEYTNSAGFQPGSTFKAFVHPGHPARHPDLLAPVADHRPGRLREEDLPAAQPGRHAHGGELHRVRDDGPLLRHPAVGEHLLPAARGAHRPVHAVEAGQQDGPAPRRQMAGPDLHPRRGGRLPRGYGGGVRHLRGPRQALRRHPGDTGDRP